MRSYILAALSWQRRRSRLAQEAKPDRVISVSGSATVYAKPDTARVYYGVRVSEPSADAVKDVLAKTSTAIDEASQEAQADQCEDHHRPDHDPPFAGGNAEPRRADGPGRRRSGWRGRARAVRRWQLAHRDSDRLGPGEAAGRGGRVRQGRSPRPAPTRPAANEGNEHQHLPRPGAAMTDRRSSCRGPTIRPPAKRRCKRQSRRRSAMPRPSPRPSAAARSR